MLYVTGKHALNLPCSLETTGDWHTSALAWNKVDLRESEDSVLKNWGIEEKMVIPNGESHYHANHLRAILDIFETGDPYTLKWLIGFRDDFLCTDNYNNEFFEKVLLLVNSPNWIYIDTLMIREFKTLWIDSRGTVTKTYRQSSEDLELTKSITNLLLENYSNIEKVVLFGSRARGDYHEYSDYDILVILDFECQSYEKGAELMNMLSSNGITQDVQIFARTRDMYNSDELIRKNIEREGVILYESDNTGTITKSK